MSPSTPALTKPMDMSTLPERAGVESAGKTDGTETVGLVLIWSRDEPSRTGEVMLVPPNDSLPWTFGRGESRGEDRRLILGRHRPGGFVATGPVSCARVSRTQLRVSNRVGGGLLIENVGACSLVYQDREVTRADVSPGDTLSLRNELLFLCVRRAPMYAAPFTALAVPLHPFGGPDAFGIVGESAPVWDLRHRIVAIARNPHHVLIVGESGSGKELVAQAIHARSPRSKRPMVSRNAATIPEGLADAELFGNLPSYPNPGMPERPGLIGEAHESTLFLDEFAELPRNLQAHLLRVMDDGEYQRLGESKHRRADVRFLGATNRPAEDLKPDVLARIKVRVSVPDLNARREDIPLLAVHLLRRHAAADPLLLERFFPDGDVHGTPLLSPVLVELLVNHQYTTHVRELEALLIRASLEARGRYIEFSAESHREIQSTWPPRAPVMVVGGLTAEECSRLVLLRQHRFTPTACGRDPAYPGNRQTADLHLRQIICKALKLAEWDADGAARVLAGEEDLELFEKARARIGTFLANVRARFGGAEEGKGLGATDDARGGGEGMGQVVDALRRGLLKP